MRLSSALSGAALLAAIVAFAVTGALSLRAQVEPFYAVVRGIVAFLGVLWLARWSASALDALGPVRDKPGSPAVPGEGRESDARTQTRSDISR